MSVLAMQRVDGVAVAVPKQDVDSAVVAAMREELAAGVGPGGGGLVLDLSGTRYVDSAGLDMIFRLGDRLATRRSALVLVIPDGSQLERLAAIVALPQAVTVKGTLDDALDAVHEMLGTERSGPRGGRPRAAPCSSGTAPRATP
ncbi:MAG TPA: STAS domain-containing protein [Solirubrobacteraceae bacterium]|nr:STAS domain-containing protein [Solirubrobacteraceae bacterium]